MVYIAPGNTINLGGFKLPQGNWWGPLNYRRIMGYFDIPVAGGTNFPIQIESPDKGVDPTVNFAIPAGAYIYKTGIFIPEKNLAGDNIDLTGTGTDALLIGASDATTGTARLAQVGGVLSAGNNVVANLAPSALGSAATYSVYVENALSSAGAVTRGFALIEYGVVGGFPNPEEVMIKEAPVYTY